MPFDNLDDIRNALPTIRAAFEMEIEAICLEIIEMAKQISPAIGEVSYHEAKDVIRREFLMKMSEEIEIGIKFE